MPEFCLCLFLCVHFDILSLFFSETKCKPPRKNTGVFLLLNWKEKHIQKFRHFWRKENQSKKSLWSFWVDFHVFQNWADFRQTDLFGHEKHRSVEVCLPKISSILQEMKIGPKSDIHPLFHESLQLYNDVIHVFTLFLNVSYLCLLDIAQLTFYTWNSDGIYLAW